MTGIEIPLRKDEERLQFCEQYFHAVGADILFTSEMYREYRLPRQIDKELTDRPFFWLWAEKTNQTVEPTTLRLAFSAAAKAREDARLQAEHQRQLEDKPFQNPYERMFARAPQAELINLGCFRLNKISESCIERGRIACVTPMQTEPSTQLVPWLMLNGFIQFAADSVSEEWFSVGVCLNNKQTVFRFYEKLQHINMAPFPVFPMLHHTTYTPEDGLLKAQQALEQLIAKRPHDWAAEAHARLQDDLSQLDAYYQSILADHDADSQQKIVAEHQRKRSDLLKKSSPHIDIQWTQMAFVGLPLRNGTNDG